MVWQTTKSRKFWIVSDKLMVGGFGLGMAAKGCFDAGDYAGMKTASDVTAEMLRRSVEDGTISLEQADAIVEHEIC